jgi:hypothetical protein
LLRTAAYPSDWQIASKLKLPEGLADNHRVPAAVFGGPHTTHELLEVASVPVLHAAIASTNLKIKQYDEIYIYNKKYLGQRYTHRREDEEHS